MKTTYTTNRLVLSDLSPKDDGFILALVNTAGWIEFIGDRKVRTPEDASNYIQRILSNPDVHYRVVRSKEQNLPIGIVTLIKRDFLAHHDIGFAFLPEYSGKGFAYEATMALLEDLANDPKHSRILATTVKENVNSIKLLKKLGFRFEKEIENEKDQLCLYAMSTDKILIDQLIRDFFGLFTNANGMKPDVERIRELCIKETIIAKKSLDKVEVFNVDTFMAPRKEILLDGTLIDFEEFEVLEETKVVGNIAQRFSKFQKRGKLKGVNFEGKGHKFFHLIKAKEGWRILSVNWEDEEF
jgi:RimJ/RimL family protein N-acetyltransferase